MLRIAETEIADGRVGDVAHALGAAHERLEPWARHEHDDHLAESEGDECEVVAAQPQHRRADEDAGAGRDQHTIGTAT